MQEQVQQQSSDTTSKQADKTQQELLNKTVDNKDLTSPGLKTGEKDDNCSNKSKTQCNTGNNATMSSGTTHTEQQVQPPQQVLNQNLNNCQTVDQHPKQNRIQIRQQNIIHTQQNSAQQVDRREQKLNYLQIGDNVFYAMYNDFVLNTFKSQQGKTVDYDQAKPKPFVIQQILNEMSKYKIEFVGQFRDNEYVMFLTEHEHIYLTFCLRNYVIENIQTQLTINQNNQIQLTVGKVNFLGHEALYTKNSGCINRINNAVMYHCGTPVYPSPLGLDDVVSVRQKSTIEIQYDNMVIFPVSACWAGGEHLAQHIRAFDCNGNIKTFVHVIFSAHNNICIKPGFPIYIQKVHHPINNKSAKYYFEDPIMLVPNTVIPLGFTYQNVSQFMCITLESFQKLAVQTWHQIEEDDKIQGAAKIVAFGNTVVLRATNGITMALAPNVHAGLARQYIGWIYMLKFKPQQNRLVTFDSHEGCIVCERECSYLRIILDEWFEQ